MPRQGMPQYAMGNDLNVKSCSQNAEEHPLALVASRAMRTNRFGTVSTDHNRASTTGPRLCVCVCVAAEVPVSGRHMAVLVPWEPNHVGKLIGWYTVSLHGTNPKHMRSGQNGKAK